MDDEAQPFVANGHNRRVWLDRGQNPVQSAQVDGLAADLDEVACAAGDAQNAAFDRSNVGRHEPAIVLRVLESGRPARPRWAGGTPALLHIPGQERFSAQGDATILSTVFQVMKQ